MDLGLLADSSMVRAPIVSVAVRQLNYVIPPRNLYRVTASNDATILRMPARRATRNNRVTEPAIQTRQLRCRCE